MIEKLSTAPQKPGVYIFKNEKERVIYVGKAKDLRSRLRSYFQKSARLDPRKETMVKNVKDFSYIATDNELEALALEANLIKQYRPKFNVILRDDKNYPYLKLTVNEEWPRIEVVRKIKKDGALYFGPYVPAGSMWEALAFIRRNFLIRECNYLLDNPMRPCIHYQMGRCPAPCDGKITREEYLKLVDEVIHFLKGEKKDLLQDLEKKMQRFSEEMRYEEAAKIRDRIKALQRAWEPQKVIDPELGDIDVINLYKEESIVSFYVFFIRNGTMIGSKDLLIKNTENLSDRKLMHTFIMQFYSKEIIPPPEIIIPFLPTDSKYLEKWLNKKKEGDVKLLSPDSGKKKELLAMASENARLAFQNKKVEKTDKILKEIQERLGLGKIPEDIGAFDISTISGNESVGAFIYWKDGDFRKNNYRRLRIKTVSGIDDYSMMEEAIERIIINLEGNIPDLIVIDGGKGHLDVSQRVIEKNVDLLHKSPMLIAVAKDPDRVYTLSSDAPVNLDDGMPSSLLLKRIRDEAHRFAIGYHKKLRAKDLFRSPLESIAGIGEKRRLTLLRHFGSIEAIRNASVNEIKGLKGFNKKIAENILKELRRKT
ncbi:MAG: excinuclease ABC subunit UvrC [Nitrospirae bacterium]|nr:excinuclease ABC subunit UvrC [Nitrospirota bacterium]